MTVRAQIQHRRAALADQFGRDMLVHHFGEERAAAILAKYGLYSRGKRKGQHRGWIHWEKVVSGGWVREFGRASGGFVRRPGACNWAVSLEFDIYNDSNLEYAAGAKNADLFFKGENK